MHIKFLGRGQGKGSAAINYVLGAYDHTGKERIYAPVVLRGNPSQTGLLADSLEFQHKYRSAVIAWHPEDKPSDEQIQEVLDAFERLAFAGLEPDQYDFTAVLHRETDSEHIHVIIPRVELSSGKSYNPSPPGWRNYYDALRDYFNSKYGWVSPDISLNPDIARITQPETDALCKGDRLVSKKLIEDYLLKQIELGVVSNREQIIIALQGFGFEIPRVGKDYVTIFDRESNQKIRLKGIIYHESWTVEQSLTPTNSSRVEESTSTRQTRIHSCGAELERRISERAQYNHRRYAKPTPTIESGDIVRSATKSKQRKKIEQVAQHELDQTVRYRRESLSWYLWRQLPNDEIFVEPDQWAIADDQSQRADASNFESTRRQSAFGTLRRSSTDLCPSRRESSFWGWLQDFKIGIGEIYDRAGIAFDQSFRKIIQSIFSGHEEAQSASDDINSCCEQIDEAYRSKPTFKARLKVTDTWQPAKDNAVIKADQT